MIRLITTLTILTVMTLSCGQNSDTENNKASITGTWIMDNLNSVDSSINRTTLFGTFLVDNYATNNLLDFSDDKTLTLKTKDGQDIGKGTYSLTNKMLLIRFPDDNIESEYKITDRTVKTLKMTAWDDSETVNISLSKKE